MEAKRGIRAVSDKSMPEEELFAAFWQGLSHPIRLRILGELGREGALNVGELVGRIGIGQGHLSNHLACLKSCGFVAAESRGRFVYYTIRDPRVTALLSAGHSLMHDHRDGISTCSLVSSPNAEALAFVVRPAD